MPLYILNMSQSAGEYLITFYWKTELFF